MNGDYYNIMIVSTIDIIYNHDEYDCVDGMIKTYVFFRLTWYLIMADENYNRWIIFMTIDTTQLYNNNS